MRKLVDGARLSGVEQRGFDRILDLTFETKEGTMTLTAELMGKHSNMMLIDAGGRVVAAAKWLGPAKTKRPILPNKRYEPPPFPPKRSLLEALPEDDLREFQGLSPFLKSLLDAEGLPDSLFKLQDVASESRYHPVFSSGHGAYPISVRSLGLAESPVASLSLGLEKHFDWLIADLSAGQVRHSLESQLERVLLAREVALAELRQAADTASRASEFQKQGELILAYAHEILPGADRLDTLDYEGNPISIPLLTGMSALENAQRLFGRSKRAKSGAAHVGEQIARNEADAEAIRDMMARLENSRGLSELEALREEADRHRWLHHQPVVAKRKEDRPYEGHAIREMLGPAGYRILFGENAEANDYLTLRVAKPNDWWLHVRGSASAHVIISTGNKPERVPREVLMAAATLAVRNSPSKHSSLVPVDYTLRKYVRRAKGASPGAALYTMEKTLHVSPS